MHFEGAALFLTAFDKVTNSLGALADTWIAWMAIPAVLLTTKTLIFALVIYISLFFVAGLFTGKGSAIIDETRVIFGADAGCLRLGADDLTEEQQSQLLGRAAPVKFSFLEYPEITLEKDLTIVQAKRNRAVGPGIAGVGPEVWGELDERLELVAEERGIRKPQLRAQRLRIEVLTRQENAVTFLLLRHPDESVRVGVWTGLLATAWSLMQQVIF